jgi:hypothetical protein
MIVGIEQIEMYGYIISAESELKVDVPQGLIDRVDDTFTAYLAAQVELTELIEPEAPEVEEEGDEWCAECGKATVADGASCSVCGFLYPVNRLGGDDDLAL